MCLPIKVDPPALPSDVFAHEACEAKLLSLEVTDAVTGSLFLQPEQNLPPSVREANSDPLVAFFFCPGRKRPREAPAGLRIETAMHYVQTFVPAGYLGVML